MKAAPRVVSLVPSWTETFLDCGVNVVGRTRYCVHPPYARAIPAVGGTKDLQLEELKALRPDIVVVDKEENLPWMAEEHGWSTVVTHASSVAAMPGELERLSRLLLNEKLEGLAGEWRGVLRKPFAPGRKVARLPGVLDWWRKPAGEPERALYMIWREPWMAVAGDTFVGSLLAHLGYGHLLPSFPKKYPEVDLAHFDPSRTLLLFSSEPFPFARKKAELAALGFPCALVDGEAYSWFGLRSLRFLQRSSSESP